MPGKVEPSALGVLSSSEPLCLHLTFDVFQGTLHDAREDGRQRTRRRLLQWAARLNKITVVVPLFQQDVSVYELGGKIT